MTAFRGPKLDLPAEDEPEQVEGEGHASTLGSDEPPSHVVRRAATAMKDLRNGALSRVHDLHRADATGYARMNISPVSYISS